MALARARRVGEFSEFAPVLVEAPPRNPPPQAGEGAHRHRQKIKLMPHANFGCAACVSRRARSVLGHSSSRPSNPDTTSTTALMVKPVM
jgi:hypothetical protein